MKKILIIIAVIAISVAGIVLISLDELKLISSNVTTPITESSITVITDKLDYKIGERVDIRIINSGTETLRFPDLCYGLKITRVGIFETGGGGLCPLAIGVLRPGEEHTTSTTFAQEGTYRIESERWGVSDSVTINIHKYVTGASLSIITDKTYYKRGDTVHITIINSGTETLRFNDLSYGLEITQSYSVPIYNNLESHSAGDGSLEPREEFTISWNQFEDAGGMVRRGPYTITSNSFTASDSTSIWLRGWS